MGWQAPTEVGKLVRRCKAGDQRAWDALVDRFSGLVYGVARRSGLNQDDAEDCAQGVFIKLYGHLDRIENPAALPGWLSVTTAREARRVRRASQKYVNVGEDSRLLDETLASDEAAADEVAALSESVFAVTEAFHGLREKCRQLLTALYLEGEPSYQEIAARLKIPIGSIGPTRARCIESLRALLAKSGHFARDEVSPDQPTASQGSKR
jgi:RNA polymerase sigma factor (sigma-70 family)